MNKRPFFALLFLPFFLYGCDSGTQSVSVQDIVELKWQPDGNALFGFMQTYVLTATSLQPDPAYSLVRFNSDGSLAQTYKSDAKAITDFSYNLYISPDGTSAVTQLDNDL